MSYLEVRREEFPSLEMFEAVELLNNEWEKLLLFNMKKKSVA